MLAQTLALLTTAALAAALPQGPVPGPPTSLQYTNYMGDASCHEDFPDQFMTINQCTFIDFDDGQGTIRWGNLIQGSDCAYGKVVHLQSWNAETCAGQPNYARNATELNYTDCETYLNGLSVMLTCT